MQGNEADTYRLLFTVVGPIATNCYFLTHEASDSDNTIIVDPGFDADTIIEFVLKHGLKPAAVLITHGHADHISAANEVKEYFNIDIYAPEAESKTLSSVDLNMSDLLFHEPVSVTADHWLKDREDTVICGFKIHCIHTPGHTPGGMCYYLPEEKILFSGDTLFRGSCGRTDFINGSTSDIIDSLKDKLFKLPTDTKVYPGHGMPTDIGFEKEYNVYA
ncbi:MAG: MBL fold metallo-hydrolase [Lachnospiraceae bacterium]|jgi:hydroxyacylglutathione hydrolase|nr:MBL fold metallo-hydrolase [Lachnospiraceae bacterium]MEE3460399.1 MBL fold metallo-hydrolase [Lachnospiraceae bacterium]